MTADRRSHLSPLVQQHLMVCAKLSCVAQPLGRAPLTMPMLPSPDNMRRAPSHAGASKPSSAMHCSQWALSRMLIGHSRSRDPVLFIFRRDSLTRSLYHFTKHRLLSWPRHDRTSRSASEAAHGFVIFRVLRLGAVSCALYLTISHTFYLLWFTINTYLWLCNMISSKHPTV